MNRALCLVSSMAFQVIFFVSIVNAQATRTWISGVGDDANPCSRTAPCKTFAGAISKTAVKGEIDVLDPGGFGAVTITKAITLDGGGNLAGVLASGTNGIVVNAGPTDVVILRNLDINGSGTGINGIQFLNGGMLFVENSTIYGFTQNGIIFTPTASSQLSIDRTLVRDASQGGLFVKPGASGTASAKITDSRFEQSSYGVRVEDRSVVSVINSVANNNTNNGFVAISTGGQALINLENCVATTNGRNGVFASGSGAVITTSNSTITNNAVMGINQQNGASIVSFGNNHIFGNTTNGTPTTILSPQ